MTKEALKKGDSLNPVPVALWLVAKAALVFVAQFEQRVTK